MCPISLLSALFNLCKALIINVKCSIFIIKEIEYGERINKLPREEQMREIGSFTRDVP